MRPGRELDTQIAQEVLGHKVYVKNNKLMEERPEGDRPLREFATSLDHAWEVAEKMNITMIPVEDGRWFAMAGKEEAWKSPAEFLQFLSTGDFTQSGAALGKSPSNVICQAALRAVEHRRSVAEGKTAQPDQPSPEAQH